MNKPTSEKSAIVVLGYSLNKDGALHPLLISRLNTAYSLYRAGTPVIVAGGMPPPQLSSNRCEKKTEALAMKEFLIEKGVNEADIFLEEFSSTTFTNAYYSRIIHLDPMGVKFAYIISNGFHMPLVRYCFNLVVGNSIKLEFIKAPNEESLNHQELVFWGKIIEIMTTQIYPILFKGVQPGDLKTIYSIFNEAHATSPNPARIAFESRLREVLSIDKTVSFRSMMEFLPFNYKSHLWAEKNFDSTYEAKWVPQTLPTLIFAGEQDHLTPLSLFLEEKEFQRDNIIIREIENASHFPWMDSPNKVQELFAEYCQWLEAYHSP